MTTEEERPNITPMLGQMIRWSSALLSEIESVANHIQVHSRLRFAGQQCISRTSNEEAAGDDDTADYCLSGWRLILQQEGKPDGDWEND